MVRRALLSEDASELRVWACHLYLEMRIEEDPADPARPPSLRRLPDEDADNVTFAVAGAFVTVMTFRGGAAGGAGGGASGGELGGGCVGDGGSDGG